MDAIHPPRQRAHFLGADLVLVEIELERDLHRETDEAFGTRDVQPRAHQRLIQHPGERREQRRRAVEEVEGRDAGLPELIDPRGAVGGDEDAGVRQGLRSRRAHLAEHAQQRAAARAESQHEMVAAGGIGAQRSVHRFALDARDEHG